VKFGATDRLINLLGPDHHGYLGRMWWRARLGARSARASAYGSSGIDESSCPMRRRLLGLALSGIFHAPVILALL
jgi:hypothetical protein